MDKVIEQFSVLMDAEKFEEAYSLVTDAINKDGNKNPELYWRYSQVCRDMAFSHGKNNQNVYTRYMEEGLRAAQTGLTEDENHPKCNSWYAIFLNYTSELSGIKKRIENSYKMKEHWLKANAADPNDGVTLHSLGRWCYEVTSLSWVHRKIAQAFFASPPQSTYPEALEYLLESEKKSPNLIANNSLLLAKTYLALGDKSRAKEYFERVIEFKTTDTETEKAKNEAVALLKSL